jgi:hypothetical protein
MGGLTPCPGLVDQVLDPVIRLGPNFPVRILDLGCGSGIWTIEMVRPSLQRLYHSLIRS